MKITARVDNSRSGHRAAVETNGNERAIPIPPKDGAPGSGVNGGELLFLALATCFCNDIHREAAKRGLKIDRVEVVVRGEFGGEGEPARNITYHARVEGDADDDQIDELLRHTDTVAEIQNTLRRGVPVVFVRG